ncbi:TRAG family protein [Desulforamulus reducens MI-1]|uniref:TRAG family protein n=1 Tax=Desulforamulus reducens (strain ATCC BAA-1160 / DSM 100696 / MI-1) TaxID=349161 RepID=A4J2S8_DESRM|nr:type IV secretory system conjugative DNA transfer family protein [Desulforamulus reducens]ABO49381.1 TRAG family protein [Desulforamulus reducens MI-1]
MDWLKKGNAAMYLVLAVVFGALVLIFPVLALVFLCMMVAWWAGGKVLYTPAIVFVTAISLGLTAGYGMKCVQQVPRFDMSSGEWVKSDVQALSIRSWFSAKELSNPGNRAGRTGVLLGSLGGLGVAVAFKRRGKKRLHGPGIVQGRPVVKGGWGDEKEAAKICEFGPPKPGKYGGGVVLGKLNGRILRVIIGRMAIAAHTAIFGATGAGKTFGWVLPNIVSTAHDGWSMVISDPKGELVAGKWNASGEYEPGIADWLKKQGYEIIILNFKDPSQGSHRWNPLFEAKDDAEFRQVCEAMILSAGKENPFFAGGESNLFTALMGLTRYGSFLKDEMRHMRTVLSLLSWPVEKLDETFEKEYRSGQIPVYFYEKWRAAAGMFNNFATGVQSKVAVMTDGPLAALTAGHDINLLALSKKKTALFCILPTIGDLKPLLTAFYYLLFKRLVEYAEANNNRLPIPVRFILDEFANIGRIPNFSNRISFDRGLGICYNYIIQNRTQLNSLYGSDVAETFLGNTDIRMALRVNDDKTAGYFTRQLGSADVWDISERKDVTWPWKRMEITKKTESKKKLDLLYPWQFYEMEFYTAVVRVPTCRPFYLDTVAFSDLKEFKELSREPKTITDFAPAVPNHVPTPAIPSAEEEDEAPTPPKRQRKRKESHPDPAPDVASVLELNKGDDDIMRMFG